MVGGDLVVAGGDQQCQWWSLVVGGVSGGYGDKVTI